MRWLVLLLLCDAAHADTGIYGGVSLDYHFTPATVEAPNDFMPGFGFRVGARTGPIAIEAWRSWGSLTNPQDDYFHQRGLDLKLHLPIHRYFTSYARLRVTEVDALLGTPDGHPTSYEGHGYGTAIGMEFHGKSPLIALMFPWLTGTELPIGPVRRGGLFLEVAHDRLKRPQTYYSEHDMRPVTDHFWMLTLGWTWGTSS